MDSTLSIKNASGKTFSLLNDTFKLTTLNSSMNVPIAPRRKYHCSEPGCNKSFTTSGHLARHNRIHTGEKNFLCLHPGCPSRFSRQDNMMQHYRTHLSQKLRRQQQQQKMKEEPQLYCHSFYGREDNILFQPLVTRPRRSATMPSLPYPPIDIINRPKRAHSTSSTCSSDSSSFSDSPSPPTTMQQYPYHYHNNSSHHRYHSQPHYHFQQPQPQQHQPQQQSQQQSQQKPVSSLYHLASIVSTFG
ncbi:hypothetical protein MFLAVUS_005353 [Mucor flavus]|uniref:C2H2-type domain-containing protein n=1 Tax=Mucor flavus TaxID=439312 RepID=A0ABP9YYG9_9FUNG